MNDLTKINMRADTHYAFLFTDIEDSTKRWAMYPTAMRAALARHDEVLRAVVAEAGGAVFKITGDGGCAVFASVGAALEAAVRLQIRLREEDFAAVDGLRFRMGVHSGPAEFRDDDYFGLTLSRTARIMAAGHGGQILVSVAASVAGAAPERYALRSLGPHRLKDLGQAEEIYQLTGPGLEGKFPPLRALDSKPNNLPLQLSSFIGREAELATVRGLLTAHKLITLLGTGGIGKTRFALQVAADALDAYADGVWFVELAGLGQGEQVAPAVASALNITLSGSGHPAVQLASALRGATMLIVLDNCEHVIEAAAALAGAVLEKNAGITLLATSRSPLGLPGEQSFALPTLSVPEASAVSGMTAELAAGYAGIRLFVERAALVQPGFRLEGENASDIAAICQRLDGIALAIELAAARVRLMRPRDLLARLNDRFRLLTGGARTRLARQQTLRALIDWSFALLDEAERVVFRRLGVFAGSFDLAGAEAVVPGGLIEPEAVLDLVVSLLDKSLIIRLPSTEREPRYRLLESTRDYALAKLAEAGETASLQRAHAQHMVAVFGAAHLRWADTDAVVWEKNIEPEMENLRASLAWAFGDDGDDGIAIALAARLRPVVRSNLLDWRTGFAYWRAAANKLTPETPGEDAAWIWLALAYDSSTSARAQADAAERARGLFEASGDRQMVGFALTRVAGALALAGDAVGVQHYADAARAILPTIPANLNKATILFNLGTAMAIAGGDAADLAAIEGDYAAAPEIFERLNDQGGMLEVSTLRNPPIFHRSRYCADSLRFSTKRWNAWMRVDHGNCSIEKA
ncbi:adenylate/guanylate cyclase domain-containing protein [Acidiphilium sp. PA]|uniref:ATP-binding protein n=1 Tax=Acidiphilium sp. PA TaxID=2871705 RepID=UPI002243F75B|nr:adenylate/guanylate cyclase domain-containing protein [Acidiphilium sp. PA]MCW8309093.1 adenylate/guanylate cyclase domain-containing protein [Acidiphilium sp. PA]